MKKEMLHRRTCSPKYKIVNESTGETYNCDRIDSARAYVRDMVAAQPTVKMVVYTRTHHSEIIGNMKEDWDAPTKTR